MIGAMSFGFAIGDFITVGQLAWTLYRDCYTVARGAPQEFQLLLGEISTLSNSLKILQEEVINPDSILRRSGEDRVRMVNEMVSRVNQTLMDLQKVAKKYATLGDSSKGKRIWQKLKCLLGKVDLSQHGDESTLNVCRQELKHEFQRINTLQLVVPALCDLEDQNLQIWEMQPRGPFLRPWKRSRNLDHAQINGDFWTVGGEQIYFQRSSHVNFDDFKAFVLLFAVKDGCRDVIMRLLENPTSESGSSESDSFCNALVVARTLASQSIRHQLSDGLHEGPKRNSIRMPLLPWAASKGHEAVVRLLIEKGAELDLKDEVGWAPLSWAAEKGHEATVKLLIEKGAKFDSKDRRGQTPLLWAVEKGHEATLLIEKGAEFDTKDRYGRTPLLRAVEKGHEATVKLLIEKGAKFDSKNGYGRTPLSWATEKGHEAMVKLLIEKGAELDSKDEWGRTPLSWAVEMENEATVKLLIEKGAEFDSKDECGRTPLSWAVEKGHEATVKLLIEKGAELDSKGECGRTPLSWAAEMGHEATVKLLIEKGAEFDFKDMYGRTPLSRAAANGHEATVKLLIEKGAEPGSKGGYGQTPLSWATEKGHETTVKLLRSKT
ncbi:hypothetical protein FGG08_001476 [Glutinoglossum americanum]|uniref:Uncharacterized protein n=1 Tax=Glutinoglossum americanum TaxID=1670608 RepID=A0A9P8L589_9PEZI|nr:hypothetical protein FGG08_001476 [Glutinoglossum americanum]